VGGDYWTEVLNAKTFFNTSEKVYMSHMNIDPSNADNVYVLASIKYYYQGILLKSTDGGDTWSKFDSNVDGKLACLTVDPNDPQTLYAGAWYDGVYRSRDGGETWQPINNGLPTIWAPFYSVAIDPTNTQHIYVTVDNSVYHSTDSGGSWSPMGPSITSEDKLDLITIDPNNPGNVYVRGYTDYGDHYVWRSYKLVGLNPHISAPSNVSVLAEPDDPDVTVRTVPISNTGGGMLNWSVSDATESWLTSQKVEDEIHLTFDKSGITLIGGQFRGTDTLTITDSIADNSPYPIVATFYVGPVTSVYLPILEK
jgi:hypothetical protein